MAKEKENIFAPWRRPRAERETEGKSVGEGKSHTQTEGEDRTRILDIFGFF